MAIFSGRNPYILLILGLLGAFLIFSAWSARQAANHGSRILDADYYSKGLRYNTTRIEERAAVSQGWQLGTSLEQQRIRFTLHDQQQQPIRQANGVVTLYLSAQQRVLRLQTTETSPGIYLLELPDDLRGNHQARVDFELQGARISRQLLVNI